VLVEAAQERAGAALSANWEVVEAIAGLLVVHESLSDGALSGHLATVVRAEDDVPR
jgi:hypothetical protein